MQLFYIPKYGSFFFRSSDNRCLRIKNKSDIIGGTDHYWIIRSPEAPMVENVYSYPGI